NAIAKGLALGYEKVCLVGSDIYDLNRHIINNAFLALDKKDAVIGPAEDGGYYLIGMKKPHAHIFELKKWSQADVLDETIRLVENENLSLGLMPTLNDIDEWEDLKSTDLIE
ncbi:MAG: glycosyltransferase, partial [Fulvivirga sp.]|nr:glycosyltransferase [Fulvivirga sp.]